MASHVGTLWRIRRGRRKGRGKLDVRAAAASLPEITELEPIEQPPDVEDLNDAVDDFDSEEVAA